MQYTTANQHENGVITPEFDDYAASSPVRRLFGIPIPSGPTPGLRPTGAVDDYGAVTLSTAAELAACSWQARALLLTWRYFRCGLDFLRGTEGWPWAVPCG